MLRWGGVPRAEGVETQAKALCRVQYCVLETGAGAAQKQSTHGFANMWRAITVEVADCLVNCVL